MKKKIVLILAALIMSVVLMQKQSMAFIANSLSYLLNNSFMASGGSAKQTATYKMPMDIVGQNTIDRSTSTSYVLNTGALPVYFSKANLELPDGGDQKVLDSLMVYATKSKSALIIWQSSQVEQGKVYYGTDEATTIAADLRGLTVESNYHFVEIKNLSPNTDYVFKVVSANLDYNNNTLLYDFRTGDILDPNLLEDIVYGKIVENDGVTPVANALVTLKLVNNDSYGSIGESGLQALLTDDMGNWHYDLAALRTSDGNMYFDYSSDGDTLEINVYNGETANKSISINTTSDSPVADIILDLP